MSAGEQSARRGSMRSIAWASAETVSLASTSFVVLVVTARYLDAAELGIAAMALSVVQLACGVVEVLFHDAIVQRTELGEHDLRSAHTVTIALGVLGSLLVFALAKPYEQVVGQPGAALLLEVMAPSVLLHALSAVPVAQLRRELDFRRVAMRTLFGRIAGAVLGISAAVAGYGALALALQHNLAIAASTAVVLWSGRASLPRITSAPRVRTFIRFAGISMVLNLLWGNIAKIFTIVAGFVLRPVAMGEVALAMRLVDLLASIVAGTLNRVSLPLFARQRREGGDLQRSYVEGTRVTTAVTSAVFTGLALVADPLVEVMAGPAWKGAVPLVQGFAIAQMLRATTYLSSPLLSAVGKLTPSLVIALAELSASLLFLLVLRDGQAWALRHLATVPLTLLSLRWWIELPWSRLLDSVWRALAAGVCMCIVVLLVKRVSGETAPWWQLLEITIAGAVAFTFTILCLESVNARRIYLGLRTRSSMPKS